MLAPRSRRIAGHDQTPPLPNPESGTNLGHSAHIRTRQTSAAAMAGSHRCRDRFSMPRGVASSVRIAPLPAAWITAPARGSLVITLTVQPTNSRPCAVTYRAVSAPPMP